MTSSRQRGFTLIEVLMTIVIIGILAAVAMRSVQSSIDGSRVRETQAEMDELLVAIAGNPELYSNGTRADFGYVGAVGALPASLDNLLTNPGAYTTWKGPYVRRRFTQDANGFKKDAWGTDYTFSSGMTLASTGGGTTPMTKSAAPVASYLTTNPVTGTVTDAAGNPPGDSSVAVTVKVTYPDGAGSTTTATTNPTSGGSFTINNIPVGIRTVQAIYRATNDTVTTYAAVLPQVGSTVSLRLPKAPFAGVGGGGGGGGIAFVDGTSSSPTDDIFFSIWNTGTSTITVTSLKANFSTTGFYQNIRWNGAAGPLVFSSANPRAASGQTVNFSASQTLTAGQAVQIRLENFTTLITGGGTALAFANEVFTVQFSNGSTIAFNSL